MQFYIFLIKLLEFMYNIYCEETVQVYLVLYSSQSIVVNLLYFFPRCLVLKFESHCLACKCPENVKKK